jgi:hypothetical protein
VVTASAELEISRSMVYRLVAKFRKRPYVSSLLNSMPRQGIVDWRVFDPEVGVLTLTPIGQPVFGSHTFLPAESVNSRRRRHVCRSPRASNRAAHSNIRTYDCANRHYPSCSSCELLCLLRCARRSLHGFEPPFRHQNFVLKATRPVARGGPRLNISCRLNTGPRAPLRLTHTGLASFIKRDHRRICSEKYAKDSRHGPARGLSGKALSGPNRSVRAAIRTKRAAT